MTFSEYIAQVGVEKLANLMLVSKTAVYDWKNLDAAPTPENALKIILLSGFSMTWEKIYYPFAVRNFKDNQKIIMKDGDVELSFDFKRKNV